MFGRRPDGRRIDGIDPVMKITPYVMPMRCDAQVFLKHRADLELMSRYIRRQKKEKGEQISYMQIVVAAYVRAVSHNPEIAAKPVKPHMDESTCFLLPARRPVVL